MDNKILDDKEDNVRIVSEMGQASKACYEVNDDDRG
jgi:hypothetical protein